MIRQATAEDSAIVAELAMLLWPDNNFDLLEKEFQKVNAEEGVFIFLEKDMAVAFAHCSLRHDYVEGTESSPVGYLEGIYVKDEYRNKGIAKKLVAECEKWAKEQGCSEFASDCELDNTDSLKFHLKIGFQEANRIIAFTKKLYR
ncbi:aminoglycoside 6'-N-acetyltransferase [Alloiococcus sp. CFN-8]|uniref:aminoglycoside 6'-N-acetyltransferase n=1 Tax=Alloiococcus sp. CFN-8 TaxID=3416081 RepID=UPI003CE67AD6